MQLILASVSFRPLLIIERVARAVPARLIIRYTVLQIYAHTGLKQNLLKSITLDIISRLLDNAAFVCICVVGRFSNDLSELRGLRSRGFQLQVECTTTALCAEL